MRLHPVGYQSDLNLYAYVGNDPVNGIDPDGAAPLFIVLPAIGGGISAALQGYETALKGGSALEIAAAAGKGFISGYAGTAAGLATALVSRSPAAVGAISGGVENVTSSLLNGNTSSVADVAKAAAAGAVIGKAANVALPLISRIAPDFAFKAAADFRQTVTNNATRLLDQTVGTSLAGGGVQAVGGFVANVGKKP